MSVRDERTNHAVPPSFKCDSREFMNILVTLNPSLPPFHCSDPSISSSAGRYGGLKIIES